jgi:hypothetical protein
MNVITVHTEAFCIPVQNGLDSEIVTLGIILRPLLLWCRAARPRLSSPR